MVNVILVATGVLLHHLIEDKSFRDKVKSTILSGVDKGKQLVRKKKSDPSKLDVGDH